MRSRELTLDILKVGLVPAFGHLAVNKSAAGKDAEPNLPPRSGGYTQNFSPRVGCADVEICFYDVVSFKTHSSDKNMFIGNGRIDLSPERLEPFRSARESNRFQFVKAGVGGHDAINSSRVRPQDCLREAQEMPEELGLWRIGLQNGPNCR